MRAKTFATIRMKWNVLHFRARALLALVLYYDTTLACWTCRFGVDLCIVSTSTWHRLWGHSAPAHDVNLIIVKFCWASLYLGIGVFRVRKTKVCSTFDCHILSFVQCKFKWAIVKCTRLVRQRNPDSDIEEIRMTEKDKEMKSFAVQDKAHHGHGWLIFIILLFCFLHLDYLCIQMNSAVERVWISVSALWIALDPLDALWNDAPIRVVCSVSVGQKLTKKSFQTHFEMTRSQRTRSLLFMPLFTERIWFNFICVQHMVRLGSEINSESET